ncbi:hypothetical protein BH24BAC1_BH24BAC1_38860 [soil metagenome]
MWVKTKCYCIKMFEYIWVSQVKRFTTTVHVIGSIVVSFLIHSAKIAIFIRFIKL